MATDADFEKLGALALLKNPDTGIDRRKCSRQVPMEVLCFGCPRTGTLSMQEALSHLGYPTYHFSSILSNVQDADMWNQALEWKYRGKGYFGKAEFDQLLGHVSATTDVPSICFWRELAEFYPDAKIVLVEREFDRWYKSIEHIINGTLAPGQWIWKATDPWWFGRIKSVGRNWITGFFGATDIATAKRNARAAYVSHYEEIRKMIPSERILEFQLGSGWAPLCTFLEKPIPKIPFPHRNEAESLQLAFKEMFAKTKRNAWRNICVVVGSAVTMGVAVRSSSLFSNLVCLKPRNDRGA